MEREVFFENLELYLKFQMINMKCKNMIKKLEESKEENKRMVKLIRERAKARRK